VVVERVKFQPLKSCLSCSRSAFISSANVDGFL
jgi:hypothetical protein